jgi:LIVCS family branched-chain amino acid:cation transporter
MIKKLYQSETLAIGLALFSMFFGAGNIIFPLAVGQYAGDKNLYAMMGLILTAAIMPIAGVIAMILFEGDYRRFFGRLGHMPGFLLALTVITLLGPLGSTPRCIALTYTTLSTAFLSMPMPLFSALACGVIFLFTIKKNYILTLLGWVLTPVLLASLIAIILTGLATPHEISKIDEANLNLFLHGLKEGYNTMDLLAAFFFSSTILTILKLRSQDPAAGTHLNIAYKASVVGAILLGLVYIGFSYLAAFHGQDLAINGKDELLAAITLKIAGSHAGLLVCIAISFACLTTAIALISAYSDFMQTEVLRNKIRYEYVLIGSLLATYLVSIFEFSGISAFLGPVLEISYPGLIVLTFLNIANRLTGLKLLKLPVFATFIGSAWVYFYY